MIWLWLDLFALAEVNAGKVIVIGLAMQLVLGEPKVLPLDLDAAAVPQQLLHTIGLQVVDVFHQHVDVVESRPVRGRSARPLQYRPLGPRNRERPIRPSGIEPRSRSLRARPVSGRC